MKKPSPRRAVRNPIEGPSAERLLLRTGAALHAFGMPSHRLEAALSDLAATLDVPVEVFSTPTSLMASFGTGEDARTRLLRIEPGDVALEKLTRLQRLLDRVSSHRIDAQAAARAVAALESAPMRFGRLSMALSFALVAAPAAVFFGGGWREAIAGAVVGLAIGLLGWIGQLQPAVERVFFPLAGAVAALLAGGISALSPHVAANIAALAGLISLLPGMTLTRAMSELAARHLVAGAARLAGALIVFLTLGFGVAVGGALGVRLYGETVASQPLALDEWAIWPALVIAAVSLMIQFQAHPRQLGWILLAGILAIFGVRVGAAFLGPELGAFVGALLVGLAGNAAARWRRIPASVVQLPGLLLLVPGSIGLRSIGALVARDTLTGIQTAFTVGMVAISLVTGLLVANVIVPSRRAV